MKTELRKHSKFSASGATRWLNCPSSVSLAEGLPDRDSKYAIEGTWAHTILEKILTQQSVSSEQAPREMVQHGLAAASFILNLHSKNPGSELLVETRIGLPFLHPEMFGTFDAGVVDHFGTLHIFDYKYGAGHAVNVRENLQMIVYGMGLAHQYDWNFSRVRLWIIQPRIKGYDGPTFWEITIDELRNYIPLFRKGIERVINEPNQYKEGDWCFFCKAKSICPLKQQKRQEMRRPFLPIK